MFTNRLRPLIQSLLAAGTALALVAGCGDGTRTDRAKPAAGRALPGQAATKTAVLPMPMPLPGAGAAPAVKPVAEPKIEVEAKGFEARMKAGKTLAKKGDIEQAIVELEKAREHKPASPLPHIELARVKLEAKMLSEAREHAQLAIELAPSSTQAWNLMGRIEMAEGDLAAATVSFERAVDENPDNSFAWNNLGYVLIKQRNWEAAAEALERATGGEKPEGYMWNNLGMAYEMLDRVVEARAAYRKGSEGGSALAGQNFARLEGVTSLDQTAKVDDEVPVEPAAPELVPAPAPAAAPPADPAPVE